VKSASFGLTKEGSRTFIKCSHYDRCSAKRTGGYVMLCLPAKFGDDSSFC